MQYPRILIDVTDETFCFRLKQWFSKWEESPFGGDFDGQGGEKNKGDNRGGETTQRERKCSITE